MEKALPFITIDSQKKRQNFIKEKKTQKNINRLILSIK